VDAVVPRQVGKEIVSSTVPEYNSDSSYEFDFGSDPIETEFELNMTEEPLSSPVAGLVITSTPAGRFVYWPDRKPEDLTDDNSRCIAYLETLPFQEGIPLAPNEDEHTPTEVVTTDSGLCTPDREVFMATGELEPQRTDLISTWKTSQKMRNQPMHPRMRLPKPRMLGATATGNEQIDASGFEKLSPSGTSMRLWIKSPIGYTPPLSNASCLSP
jgi:hypothetical protein